jgi:hypothetical protein
MRYFRDGTWAAIQATVSRLLRRRNAVTTVTTMTSPLTTCIRLRQKAEQTARAGLERAAAARIEADEREARLVEIRHTAEGALLRAERHRPSPSNAAEAQAQERYRARLAAAALRATRDVEQHRQGPRVVARAAEAQARAAYLQASAALAAAELLARRRAEEAGRQADRRAEDAAAEHSARQAASVCGGAPSAGSARKR